MTGLGFAGHRPGQAVIRAVTCFGILLPGAACFTAFHGALGDGPPAHRIRLRQNYGQLTYGRRYFRTEVLANNQAENGVLIDHTRSEEHTSELSHQILSY